MKLSTLPMGLLNGVVRKCSPMVAALCQWRAGQSPIICAEVISSSQQRLHVADWTSGSNPVRYRCLFNELWPVKRELYVRCGQPIARREAPRNYRRQMNITISCASIILPVLVPCGGSSPPPQDTHILLPIYPVSWSFRLQFIICWLRGINSYILC